MAQLDTGQPMPAEVQERPILREKVWKRIHRKDKNWMGIVCGETGSGKSEFGLRLCELLDPDFSEDQIAHTIQEFIELVNEDRPPGSFILFDEVGVALSHATHYDEDQIRLNHVLETWRSQNRGLVMTAPHMGLVQKSSRGLLHAQMDMLGINLSYYLAEARYRRISTDTDDGELYKKYPRLREDGRKRKFRTLQLYKPSPDIVEPYQEKKEAFNDSLNEDVLQQVRPDDSGSGDDGTPDDPRALAEHIVERSRVEEFVNEHGGNGTRFVDKDLLELEFGLSHREARKCKKSIESQVEI